MLESRIIFTSVTANSTRHRNISTDSLSADNQNLKKNHILNLGLLHMLHICHHNETAHFPKKST